MATIADMKEREVMARDFILQLGRLDCKSKRVEYIEDYPDHVAMFRSLVLMESINQDPILAMLCKALMMKAPKLDEKAQWKYEHDKDTVHEALGLNVEYLVQSMEDIMKEFNSKVDELYNTDPEPIFYKVLDAIQDIPAHYSRIIFSCYMEWRISILKG